jgi:hypothetical protein
MFERTDYPTIQDGLVVRYEIRGNSWDGEINASRNGVSISGHWPIMSHDGQVDEIIDTLKKARAHHIEMRDWPTFGSLDRVALTEQQAADAAGVDRIAPMAERQGMFA